jgi:hypothetical protein
MLIAEAPTYKKFDGTYVRLDDFRKTLITTLLEAGKGQVIWSKSTDMQKDKLRQIVVLDGKKYMIHFWKNKLTDIYLMRKKS